MSQAPRSVKVLQILAQSSASVRLEELLQALGESGRKAQGVNVTMLLSLTKNGLVEPRARSSGSARRGRGYLITASGRKYLETKLERHPDWADELDDGIVETGAMRGETKTVIQRIATDVAAPACDMPNWVFGLARDSARLQLH